MALEIVAFFTIARLSFVRRWRKLAMRNPFDVEDEILLC
jgi:hypothetical protein